VKSGEDIRFRKVEAGGDEAMFVAGLDVNGVFHRHSPLEAQLQATLNTVPAHARHALQSGALTFANGRAADYLGFSKAYPSVSARLPARMGTTTSLRNRGDI
jgi:hypothetical protein